MDVTIRRAPSGMWVVELNGVPVYTTSSKQDAADHAANLLMYVRAAK